MDDKIFIHRGPIRWTLVANTRVLRIAGSPFAAMPEPGVKNAYFIFHVDSRQQVAWTRGSREEVRARLISTERDHLEQPKESRESLEYGLGYMQGRGAS